jgi:putative ABC transport system substrate-binding protein
MSTRRAFLSATGAVWLAPIRALGQSSAKVYRIGYLGTAAIPGPQPEWNRFQARLRELGYIDGQNMVIEFRSSEGHEERFPALAAELVDLKVDVIVAPGTAAARAARDATATIPIVTVLVSDPVGLGLVASLARPGGNITGMSSAAKDIAGKQLQLLKELLPGLSRVAVLWSSTTPAHPITLKEVEAAAKTLQLQVRTFDVRTPESLERSFRVILGQRAGALMPLDGPFMFVQRRRIADFAAKNRLPLICSSRAYPDVGALMSYGPSFSDLYYRAATYVDKILKGAKPADLPVEQPTKFELVINLKTAKAFGLTIPPALLGRTDEVIQ